MLLHAFDINVLSSRNIASTYRCEMRDDASRVFYCERVPGTRIIYCETEEDSTYCEAGRKRVYSYGANHYNFTDILSRKAVRSRMNNIPSIEVRIYNPHCPIEGDMLVIVSTRINGMYVQLYGGLYSECERNSYELVRHGNKMYCEYSAFHIPRNITGSVYTSITVTLIPVSYVEDNRYYPSDEYTLGSKSFTKDFKLNLKSSLMFRDGVLCLSAVTDVTRSDFEKEYKHTGVGATETLKQVLGDSYDVRVCLYEGDTFTEDTLLYKASYDAVTATSDPDAPLVDSVFPVTNTPPGSSGTYGNIDVNILDEKYHGTRKLDWSSIPQAAVARVEITYQCVNAYGEELTLDFVSNPVPVLRDSLKYLIDKPAVSLDRDYFDDYNNYKTNHMLNINITSPCEEASPGTPSVNGTVPFIIQKPIFFKVQPVQQITLVKGVAQRVGVNLQEYETKVSCFYIKIGSHQFPERERTETYVIFKIDTTLLEGTETTYHVLDQDSELLTSGKLLLQ